MTFSVSRFSDVAFEAAIRAASGIPEKMSLPAQAVYLMVYLGERLPRAQTILTETPYIDRHFMAEYQGYYATTFRDQRRETTRLHLFSQRFDDGELDQSLADPVRRSKLNTQLQQSYLGFVVVRPLAVAPIGRTVLRPYDDEPARLFGPARPPTSFTCWGSRSRSKASPSNNRTRP